MFKKFDTPPPKTKEKLVKFCTQKKQFLNFFVKKWWNFITKKNTM